MFEAASRGLCEDRSTSPFVKSALLSVCPSTTETEDSAVGLIVVVDVVDVVEEKPVNCDARMCSVVVVSVTFGFAKNFRYRDDNGICGGVL